MGIGTGPGRRHDRRLRRAVMGMFGTRGATRASTDFSWLFPDVPQSTELPNSTSWLFPNGVPRADNGPDPFGYNPPFRPLQTLPTAGQSSTLSQRCLDALQVTHKSPEDVARVSSMMPTLRTAATPFSTDPHLLAAIALRETGGKNIAEIGKGKGMGVFQLTNRPDVTSAQAYDIPSAASYAAKMLAQNRSMLSHRAPNFTADQLTQATAAAYNKGGNKGIYRITSDPRTIDVGTKASYGRNVFDLMDCFQGQ